jgi:hypothetical protein
MLFKKKKKQNKFWAWEN